MKATKQYFPVVLLALSLPWDFYFLPGFDLYYGFCTFDVITLSVSATETKNLKWSNLGSRLEDLPTSSSFLKPNHWKFAVEEMWQ